MPGRPHLGDAALACQPPLGKAVATGHHVAIAAPIGFDLRPLGYGVKPRPRRTAGSDGSAPDDLGLRGSCYDHIGMGAGDHIEALLVFSAISLEEPLGVADNNSSCMVLYCWIGR